MWWLLKGAVDACVSLYSRSVLPLLLGPVLLERSSVSGDILLKLPEALSLSVTICRAQASTQELNDSSLIVGGVIA